jgi:heat shock protein HtpX
MTTPDRLAVSMDKELLRRNTMKRILLFLATNMAIVLVLSVTMRLLGVEPYLNANGLNLTSLLIFAAVMGFGGSLHLARHFEVDGQEVDGRAGHRNASQLDRVLALETVRKYSEEAGIKMPEVGIYDAPDVNAFATGMSKNSSLIAVSTGLLQQMTRAKPRRSSATKSPTPPMATW